MSQAKLVMLLGFWREKDRLFSDVTVLLLLIGCSLHSALATRTFGLEYNVLSHHVLLTKSALSARQCAPDIPNNFPITTSAT